MKIIFTILISILLTSCLCLKHPCSTVKDKITGEKSKLKEAITINDETGDEMELFIPIHKFNYIVLCEKNNSITVKKMSKFRLKFYNVNKQICDNDKERK